MTGPKKNDPAKKKTAASSSRATKPASSKPAKPLGSVAFVGAGPGDPELMTVRAVELLGRADVVITESQDEAFVRRFCREDVEVVDVAQLLVRSVRGPGEATEPTVEGKHL